MTKLGNLIDKYSLYAKRYDCKKKAYILTLENEQVVLKEKRKNKKELFSYLDSKDFRYFLKPTNIEAEEEYEIYPYIKENIKKEEEKAIDMMYMVSLLHNKTSFYKETALDDKKAIYEEITSRIEYLYYYYHTLQDSIEKKIYMAPDEYLLMRNMSLIYISLEYAKNKINEWYEQIKNKKSMRYVMLHGNLETSHFLEGDNAYLISWDQARRDLPIYDFLTFYQNEYQNLDMNTLYPIYNHKYPYTKEEENLLYTLIAIPRKIEMNKNTYNKYSDIYNFVVYLNKSLDFLSKQDKSYKKTNE